MKDTKLGAHLKADGAKPLFMWAGGKNKMLKHYASIERPKYKTYVEPFFGGGAMFLAEAPDKAIINDINDEIMQIYSAIRDRPDDFLSKYQSFVNEYFDVATDERKEYYYEQRKKYWSDPSVEHLYLLMKLGFNGIWQTCKDSNGLFGTPAGLLNHSKEIQILDEANIREWSARLSNTEIHSSGFDKLSIPENSFIFCDPPYRGSFTSYGKDFDDGAQRYLVGWCELQAKDSTVWLSNREVEGDDFFEQLLPDSDFHYFDVTYTAGRRKKTEDGYEAKKAREILVCL